MADSSAPSASRVFISYRREETAYPAGWLFDRLADRFGHDQIFKDVDSIELGDDFVEVITSAVGSCDVLLALIGEQWLTITDEQGRRRLDDPNDFVRLELEAALTRNVRVIPILVAGARMPRPDQLPPSLAKLVRRHALELSPSHFQFDTSRLHTVLDRALAEVNAQRVEQLRRQIREHAAAQDWDAVLAVNDQLTVLDPAAVEGPDGLAGTAREQITRRREAEQAVVEHRHRVEQLQRLIREHAAAQDWDAVLAVNDQLTVLDPAAVEGPDGLAGTAREQITRRREAEQAVIEHRHRVEQLQRQIREHAAAQDWDAVLTVVLDPAATDPDRLAGTAREQITRRREAEQAVVEHRHRVEQLQRQIRERATEQDWDAGLAVNDQLAALDPAAARSLGGLVGRDGQLTVLQDAMRAASERATVVLISGEAGIGKSRLVEAFTDQANQDRQLVLVGGCVSLSGESIPYAPVVEVVRQIRRRAGALGTLSEHAIAEVDALLELRMDQLPRNRADMLERTLGLLELVRPADTVLVLVQEDVHWADEASIDLIGFLARNLAAGTLLLMTYRGEEVEPASSLRTLLRRLRTDSRVRYLELPPLSGAELTQLATARLGRAPSRAEVERLSTRSEGNPFFAEELLAAGEFGGVPDSLQEVLLARADRLSGDAKQVVRVAAMIGRPVDHDTLAAAAGLDEPRLLAAVKQGVGCGLLSVDRQRERYVFRHVLTQDAVLATLLPGERRRLHRAVADALATQPDLAVSASRAVEWATHLLAGGAPRDEAGAAALTAARLAAGVYAYADAWRLYQRAVELATVDEADFNSSASVRAGLFAEAAEAARRAGAVDAAARLASEALVFEAAAEKRAMLMESLGRDLWEIGNLHWAGRLFDEAANVIAAFPPSELTARIAASQAQLDYARERLSAAAERARQVIELAELVHAPTEEARARSVLGSCLVHFGDITAGLELVRQGREMTEQWGDIEDRQRADTRYAYALHMAGRTRDACDAMLSALATVRRYGTEVTKIVELVNNLLTALRQVGRWPEAEQLAADLLGEDLHGRQARLIELCRAELDIARGLVTAARSHLAGAWKGAVPSQEPAITSDLYLAEAELALLGNDFDAASVAIRAAAAAAEASEVDRVRARVAQRGLYVLADLAHYRRPAKSTEAADEPPSADYFRSQLRACVARSPSAEIAAYAKTGEAEYSRSRRMSDTQLWQQAAQSWEALDRPRGLAYCTLRWAEAELLAGRATAAVELVRRAHDLASQLGAEPITRAAADLAQRGRIPLEHAQLSPMRRPDA
jgi:AAA ATPase domain/TIR domain